MGIPAVAGAGAGAFTFSEQSLDVNGDSFVVIAVVDTGVNPYHDAFAGELYPRNTDADPTNNVDFTAHPSTYITGFPSSATSISLSLTIDDYATAVAADTASWQSLQKNKLYWIPGTKIIGAYSNSPTTACTGQGGPTDTEWGPYPILDCDGHGTAVASIAGGNPGAWQTPEASCPECLLVVVKGFSGLSWALAQPWIDIVSNSWGPIGNLGFPKLTNSHLETRDAVEAGKTVLFASGNGYENGFLTPELDYLSEYTGPAWNIRVGAVDTTNEYNVVGDGTPVDLSSYGDGYLKAASAIHTKASQNFGGTSAATPYVASAFGRVLLEARKTLGDSTEGPRVGQIVAQGAPTGRGLLADGKLTRAELREAVLKTATAPVPPGLSKVMFPQNLQQTYYLFGGYGVSKLSATLQAVRVVHGDEPMPDRSDADAFFQRDYAIRDQLWGGYDSDGDGVREFHTFD